MAPSPPTPPTPPAVVADCAAAVSGALPRPIIPNPTPIGIIHCNSCASRPLLVVVVVAVVADPVVNVLWLLLAQLLAGPDVTADEKPVEAEADVEAVRVKNAAPPAPSPTIKR